MGGDHYGELSEALADVLAILAEEFGGEAPDAKTVAEALRGLDGDHDPHAGAAVALIDHAIAAAEAGEDVQPGLDRIIDLLDGGEGEEVEKASWDSAKHPRGDDGRFISRDAIADAKGDPAKEEELRKRVTDPAERKKLDAALGGDTELGRTRRGQARADAAERRKTRQASKEKATEVLRRIRANGEVTADDVRDLADHLPALTVAELRLHREALMAKLGGRRVKDQYVRSLVEHARGKVADKPKKPARQRRPVVSDTIVAAVRRFGGIDPDSLAFRGHYSGVREATEDNVPLSIFRRGGSGLDELAQEMQAEGLITVPDGEHPSEYLLDLIRTRAHTHAADLSAQYEDALDEHYRLLQEHAARGPDAEEALRLGEEAGVSAFAEGAGDEGLGEAGERDGEEELTGDDSFDFGYNAAGDGPAGPESTSAPAPEPNHDHATRDHTADLEAIASNQSAYVGGHLVRRLPDGRFQMESGGKYRTAESAEAVNAKIRSSWARQKFQKPEIDDALARADGHDEPDPFTDPKGAAAVSAGRARVPDGARAVSLDPNTRGRAGVVARDENGVPHLLLDGETRATDFEPLKREHSWRNPRAESGGLFGDDAPAAAGPAPTPAADVAPAAPAGDTPPDSEAAFAAELERDKTHAGTLAEREKQVSDFLGGLRAKHSDDELRALAKKVTGRGGRTAKQALDYLRADLLAVSRLMESQKV